MTDYIKRSDACAEVDRGDLLVDNSASWAKECINRTPSADVVEVKHGTWKPVNKECGNSTEGVWTERFLQCSECNTLKKNLRELKMEKMFSLILWEQISLVVTMRSVL